MSVWFEGNRDIDCNIQQVQRALDDHGDLYVGSPHRRANFDRWSRSHCRVMHDGGHGAGYKGSVSQYDFRRQQPILRVARAQRPNTTFLAMMTKGLTSAITNPLKSEIIATVRAADLFIGLDPHALGWIQFFREQQAE